MNDEPKPPSPAEIKLPQVVMNAAWMLTVTLVVVWAAAISWVVVKGIDIVRAIVDRAN